MQRTLGAKTIEQVSRMPAAVGSSEPTARTRRVNGFAHARAWASSSWRFTGRTSTATSFVEAAMKAGAAGAVVEAQQPCGHSAQIVVPNTQKALEKAAHEWRRGFSIPLVGVAGSNGKTTVKEMTSTIFCAGGHVPRHARQSQQSHRRAAHAIFRLDADQKLAVVEMGRERAR